jgi:hypothetical protein
MLNVKVMAIITCKKSKNIKIHTQLGVKLITCMFRTQWVLTAKSDFKVRYIWVTEKSIKWQYKKMNKYMITIQDGNSIV